MELLLKLIEICAVVGANLLLLTVCLLCSNVLQTTHAAVYSEELELQKQEKIENIFNELNEIAARKQILTVYA